MVFNEYHWSYIAHSKLLKLLIEIQHKILKNCKIILQFPEMNFMKLTRRIAKDVEHRTLTQSLFRIFIL